MARDPYRERRDRLIEKTGSGVTLIRGAAGRGAVNRDFFYLTGIEERRGALLLSPEGIRIDVGRENPGRDYVRGRMAGQVLFLPQADPLAARWGEDAAATVQSVPAETAGVDAVLAETKLTEVLTRALGTTDRLHYVRGTPPSLSTSSDVDTEFTDRVRSSFLNVTVTDATGHVHEMRRLKDPGEVKAIERSIDVTGRALAAVMAKTRAGMHEYQLEAEITSVYRSAGAVHGFDPIVAAGPNALLLHYGKNSGPIEAGGLVLIDTGASLAGYGADISRTFPVGDSFTNRQREVYEIVLHALEAAIAQCKPGALLADIHAAAFDEIEAAGFGDYFVHGTSHHLGLETHDVGDVHAPLAPGAVITVEPGIYIPEEEIGVRIEDDVLITGDGHRVLSAAIPRTVEEVERAARD